MSTVWRAMGSGSGPLLGFLSGALTPLKAKQPQQLTPRRGKDAVKLSMLLTAVHLHVKPALRQCSSSSTTAHQPSADRADPEGLRRQEEAVGGARMQGAGPSAAGVPQQFHEGGLAACWQAEFL